MNGDDVEPTICMRQKGGHFVAHFEEEGQWFTADDLGQSWQVERWQHGERHKVPFVCFLEREDSRTRHGAQSPWPPGQDVCKGVEELTEDDASKDEADEKGI